MTTTWKAVRVFIASTFRDMHAERDYLANVVFPALRERCERYGIDLIDIDLRSDVTEVQFESAEILPASFNEIDRCDVFLGLLGDCYGRVLDEIPHWLAREQPWLEEYPGRSIVEWEIRHGVLNRVGRKQYWPWPLEPVRRLFWGRAPATEPRLSLPTLQAIFYFRSRLYSYSLPPAQRADLLAEDQPSRVRLRQLKDEIGRATDVSRKGYRDVQHLGQLVFHDLGQLMEQVSSGEKVLNLPVRARQNNADTALPQGDSGTQTPDYDSILTRLEEDFDRDRPNLVRDVMTAMCVARRGLWESEMLHFLGWPGASVSYLEWARFFCAAREMLTEREGQMLFTDEACRAVEGRFLAADEDRIRAHQRFADFCAVCDLSDRMVEEYPWHLAQAGNWRQLFQVLSDLTFLEAACKKNEIDVRSYWGKIESQSSLCMTDAYRPVVEEPERHLAHVWRVASLLHESGHAKEALRLREFQVDHCRAAGDNRLLADALSELSLSLRHTGDMKRAMECLLDEETLVRELRRDWELAHCLGSQAVIQIFRGDLDAGMKLLHEQERLSRVTGNHVQLIRSLGNQSRILGRRGEKDGECRLLREVEGLCRQHNQTDDLATTLTNIAVIHVDQGELDQAMELYQEIGQIAAAINSPSAQAASYAGQAFVLRKQGRLEEAAELFSRQEQICRATGATYDVARSLDLQAGLQEERGDAQAALGLLEAAEQIFRDMDAAEDLARILGRRAGILNKTGETKAALRLLEDQAIQYQQLGRPASVAANLEQRAEILKESNQLEQALDYLSQAEDVRRDLGEPTALAAVRQERAHVLWALGKQDEALTLLADAEAVFRANGRTSDGALNVAYQALYQRERGADAACLVLMTKARDLCRQAGKDCLNLLRLLWQEEGEIHQQDSKTDQALAAFAQETEVCRQLSDQHALQLSLERRANLLYNGGQSEAALPLYVEQEQICRAIGNLETLQRCLGNQALVQKARKDFEAAQVLYEKQADICRTNGFSITLASCLGDLASLYRLRKEPKAALRTYQEQARICVEQCTPDNLQVCLCNQANIYFDFRFDLGGAAALDKALALYEETERICRDKEFPHGLQVALGNQALVYQTRSQNARALEKYRQQADVLRELNTPSALITCLENQANLKHNSDDLDGALTLYREIDDLCRKANEKRMLQACLYNQELVHRARTNWDAVRKLLQERIAVSQELNDDQAVIDCVIARNRIEVDQQAGEAPTRSTLETRAPIAQPLSPAPPPVGESARASDGLASHADTDNRGEQVSNDTASPSRTPTKGLGNSRKLASLCLMNLDTLWSLRCWFR